MTLTELFSISSQFKLGNKPFCEISSITSDSRTAKAGDVFVAVRGRSHDGHRYLQDVCARNVAAVVVEDESAVPASFTGGVLKVANSRIALGELAARFYGDPARSLFCVGVTGTNGKTSTAFLIEAILNDFGMKTGVIGTVDHHLADRVWPTNLTSPEPVTLQKRLREFRDLGAKALVMEVSSQALDQDRAVSIPFEVAVFTNLTRDHLDYHVTMANYFRAKERLFRPQARTISGLQTEPALKLAVINLDDEWGRKLELGQGVRRCGYGETHCDFQFQILEMNFKGTRFRLVTRQGEIEVDSPLLGRHNVYNVVAAIAVGVRAGASLETCALAVKKFNGVPGRLQPVPNTRGLHVLVDYAHTDDALREVLRALQAIRERAQLKSRILTVFGCGGDRDKGKRPLMAKAAIENSDLVFVTSDNPRSEAPAEIIRDILDGVPTELMNSKVFVEVDRKECIGKAIKRAVAEDVVLIAGKGHETYQIVGDRRVDMDDREIARSYLQE